VTVPTTLAGRRGARATKSGGRTVIANLRI